MNRSTLIKHVLGLLNSKKDILDKPSEALLWDYYKGLTGQRKVSEERMELGKELYEHLLKQEANGEEPLSEIADLKYRVKQLEESLALQNETIALIAERLNENN